MFGCSTTTCIVLLNICIYFGVYILATIILFLMTVKFPCFMFTFDYSFFYILSYCLFHVLHFSDGNISVPVGGTDIKQELIPSYQNRPPSGSSSRSLSETKSTHADRATLESGRPSRNASSTLKKLPGSSSSLHSDYSVEILDTHSAKSGRYLSCFSPNFQ